MWPRSLARFGRFVLARGLLADLLLHALSSDGYPAHVAVFVGMLPVAGRVIRQACALATTHSRKGTRTSWTCRQAIASSRPTSVSKLARR